MMRAPQRGSVLFQGKWAMAILLSAGLAMDYLARVALNSVFPLLRTDLAMTDVQIGLTATVFLWTYGLLSPVAGFLGDRFSRRKVLIGSVVGWNLVTVLSGFATSAWQIIFMRLALAFAQVCYVPTAQALITDHHGRDTQGKAIGIFQAGCYVGIFLAGLPAAYIATHLGWRMMLILFGGMGLLFAGFMLYLPKDSAGSAGAAQPTHESPEHVSVREAVRLFRVPSLSAIMVAFALSAGAYWILFTYLPLFVYEHYRLSLESAAFQATFYMQAAAMVSDPFLGHVSDKWSARNPRNRFLFCAVAGFIGLPALGVVGFGNHIAILIAGLLLFGLASAGADVSWMPMLSYVTSKYQRATAFGYLNMAACLTGGLTTIIAAVTMKRFGLGLLIALGGVLFFLLAVVLVISALAFLRRDFIPDVPAGSQPQEAGPAEGPLG